MLTNLPIILRIWLFSGILTVLGIIYFAFKNNDKTLCEKKNIEKEKEKIAKYNEKGITIKGIDIIYSDIKEPYQIVPIISCDKVLPILYKNPVNFKGLEKKTKKEKFIAYMLPQILIVHHEIEEKRRIVLNIKKKFEKGEEITEAEEKILKRLLKRYKARSINELLDKLNVNPPSLVLAQAIAESGWGTSRFYLEGRNAFGITAFSKKGEVMKMKGANIYLRKYKYVINSIRDYYYSVNVSWAFKKFRKVRLTTNNPFELSQHLTLYSTLRKIYINRIKKIIRENNLEKYDKCRIDPSFIKDMELKLEY